jgi:transcriptional regulator with XRE-family HTH domain
MPNTDDQRSKAAIGHRLQLTRQALGLNQTGFCARAGVARTAYTQYESGDKRPSIESANSLCDAYDLTLDWIYRGEMAGLTYELANAIKAITGARTTL